ncbi:PRD domain-containing protein [Caldibacillus thermoamylovorans]|uniref:PRD domain-containing protein n=1 Tax=Caldibacillus thermoamylovorans TaxID=35841 RepID=UPI0029FEE4FC|nr:PRD domain-containing protein [Caldibacillus thermoamylovorans]
MHSDIEEIKQQKEYQVATEIAADVENYYHVKFPQQESPILPCTCLGLNYFPKQKVRSIMLLTMKFSILSILF